MKFVEKLGDVTCFDIQDNTIHFVPNVVNTAGIASSGVVVSLRNKWESSMRLYEYWANPDLMGTQEEFDELDATFPKVLGKDNKDFQLGNVQFAKVEPCIYVVNILGQKNFGGFGMPPGRYEAIEECLRKLEVCCQKVLECGKEVSIEACKFGSARSGLDWTRIFGMVQDIFGATAGTWNTYSYEGPNA